MFRSLMAIIRELYLYLTKVIFMLKHSVKLRRYINWVTWQHVVERHAALYINLVKRFKVTLKYTIISLLHVSVFNGHHQGALSIPN